MNKYICIAVVEIEAESKEDAQIELSKKVDAHDIDWRSAEPE